MGTAPSLQLDQAWHEVQTIPHRKCSVFRNSNTGQEMQKYVCTTQQSQIESAIAAYKQRQQFPLPHTVEMLKYLKVQNKNICTSGVSLIVFLQRIGGLLSGVKRQTHEKTVRILRDAMIGFDGLKRRQQQGFEITDDMIGFNKEGQVKVWFNENFVENIPSTKIYNSQNNYIITQEQMIKNLFDVVETHRIQGKFPQGYRDRILRAAGQPHKFTKVISVLDGQLADQKPVKSTQSIIDSRLDILFPQLNQPVLKPLEPTAYQVKPSVVTPATLVQSQPKYKYTPVIQPTNPSLAQPFQNNKLIENFKSTPVVTPTIITRTNVQPPPQIPRTQVRQPIVTKELIKPSQIQKPQLKFIPTPIFVSKDLSKQDLRPKQSFVNYPSQPIKINTSQPSTVFPLVFKEVPKPTPQAVQPTATIFYDKPPTPKINFPTPQLSVPIPFRQTVPTPSNQVVLPPKTTPLVESFRVQTNPNLVSRPLLPTISLLPISSEKPVPVRQEVIQNQGKAIQNTVYSPISQFRQAQSNQFTPIVIISQKNQLPVPSAFNDSFATHFTPTTNLTVGTFIPSQHATVYPLIPSNPQPLSPIVIPQQTLKNNQPFAYNTTTTQPSKPSETSFVPVVFPIKPYAPNQQQIQPNTEFKQSTLNQNSKDQRDPPSPKQNQALVDDRSIVLPSSGNAQLLQSTKVPIQNVQQQIAQGHIQQSAKNLQSAQNQAQGDRSDPKESVQPSLQQQVQKLPSSDIVQQQDLQLNRQSSQISIRKSTSPIKQATKDLQSQSPIQESVQESVEKNISLNPIQESAQKLQSPFKESAEKLIQIPVQDQSQKLIQTSFQELDQKLQVSQESAQKLIQTPIQESANKLQSPIQESAEKLISQSPVQESAQKLQAPIQESAEKLNQTPVQEPSQKLESFIQESAEKVISQTPIQEEGQNLQIHKQLVLNLQTNNQSSFQRTVVPAQQSSQTRQSAQTIHTSVIQTNQNIQSPLKSSLQNMPSQAPSAQMSNNQQVILISSHQTKQGIQCTQTGQIERCLQQSIAVQTKNQTTNATALKQQAQGQSRLTNQPLQVACNQLSHIQQTVQKDLQNQLSIQAGQVSQQVQIHEQQQQKAAAVQQISSAEKLQSQQSLQNHPAGQKTQKLISQQETAELQAANQQNLQSIQIQSPQKKSEDCSFKKV